MNTAWERGCDFFRATGGRPCPCSPKQSFTDPGRLVRLAETWSLALHPHVCWAPAPPSFCSVCLVAQRRMDGRGASSGGATRGGHRPVQPRDKSGAVQSELDWRALLDAQVPGFAGRCVGHTRQEHVIEKEGPLLLVLSFVLGGGVHKSTVWFGMTQDHCRRESLLCCISVLFVSNSAGPTGGAIELGHRLTTTTPRDPSTFSGSVRLDPQNLHKNVSITVPEVRYDWTPNGNMFP